MASIFSKIIEGELPGHFIWRDDRAVAIMTIAPICPGHVLVIPTAEIDHWDDMPTELAAHCVDVARSITKAIKVQLCLTLLNEVVEIFPLLVALIGVLIACLHTPFAFARLVKKIVQVISDISSVVKGEMECCSNHWFAFT